MEIVRVSEENFHQALEVYTRSWRESHRHICSPGFLENRNYSGYLKRKMGQIYLVTDEIPVGMFCLDGAVFCDLYIHPETQGRGYGTACISYAKSQSARLRLTVLSDNDHAIHLYQNNGFRFTGNDVFLRDGLWEWEMECVQTEFPI